MGLVGADVDQMRALARALAEAAQRLESTTTAVTGTLAAVPWRGPDAERYRSQWHGQSMATMRSVAAALRDAAHIVLRNAEEQETASAATSSMAVPPPILDTLPWRFHPMSFGEPVNPFVNARDFLNSNAVWPITWGTLLGGIDRIAPALPLLDALGLAGDSRLSDEEKIIEAGNSFTGLVGGLIKGPTPVSYLAGVAVTQWGDVAAEVARADFSPSGVKTVTDYITTNPGEAFDAAKDAVIDYVPKLFSNLVPW